MSHPTLLILVRDLLLASQITAAAKARGVVFLHLRDPARLSELANQPGLIKLVVFDCNLNGAIPAVAEFCRVTQVPAVGFVSHVDGQTIALAREAGLSRILARSAFFSSLDTLVNSALDSPSPPLS